MISTKQNSTCLHSLEIIYSAYYDSDMNSDHSKRDLDVTLIDSTDYTTCSSQNHNVNVICNFYAPFLFSINRYDVSIGT